MQEPKQGRMIPVYLTLDEEVYKRLKQVTTHHGQQTYEMRIAISERLEKLEQLQQDDEELKAS